MKDKSMEKFVIFPFSLGCVSESSVPVANTNKSQPTSKNYNKDKVGEEMGGSRMKINGFWGSFLAKKQLSQGVNTLKKNFKGFSQLFVYKEDIEEMEMEMEIGYPTDVKHVTHIGMDGSTKVNNPIIKGWDNSFPSLSIQQFELAMAGGSSRF